MSAFVADRNGLIQMGVTRSSKKIVPLSSSATRLGQSEKSSLDYYVHYCARFVTPYSKFPRDRKQGKVFHMDMPRHPRPAALCIAVGDAGGRLKVTHMLSAALHTLICFHVAVRRPAYIMRTNTKKILTRMFDSKRSRWVSRAQSLSSFSADTRLVYPWSNKYTMV